jgi:hypothetical protein
MAGSDLVTLRGLLRTFVSVVRSWLDPRSYRPLYLLATIALSVLFLPLAIDLFWVLFFGIPAPIRHGFAHAVVVAAIGVGIWRIWLIRPGDQWPIGIEERPPSPVSVADRWIPWALRLAALSLAIPLLRNPNGIGFSDWDFVLDKFEAVRRTILIWGQFPWWNPWCRGGFPLAAEPQIGAMSIATPLILAFGTGVGLRLSAIVCILLAVEGSFRLGRLLLNDTCGAAATALVYGLNGAVLVSTSLGYILPMSYCVVPWLALNAFRIGRRYSDGLWLGFWLAFTIMNGIQYLILYSVPLTGLIWLRALRLQPSDRRRAFWNHTFAAAGVFLLLCGWRLSTMLVVLLEDQRESVTYWDETPLSMLRYLISRPEPGWNERLSAAAGSVFGELNCYVGLLVVALAILSLARGWRFWHILALFCFWLACGSVRWWQPSAWVAKWPFIGSAHVVTRWRMMGLLGVALAAGSTLANWKSSPRALLRALAYIALMAIAGDYLLVGYQQLPLAFHIEPQARSYPGPPVREIINVGDGLGFPCVTRGYGLIRGYEPMLSYYRNAPTLRRAREDADYHGEAWTDDGRTVAPVFWSPNRLVFQVNPGEFVTINENPGSWWWANGRQAFPGKRCAELLVPFRVPADERGRLVLDIYPRGLNFGFALQALGACLIGLTWLARSRSEVEA